MVHTSYLVPNPIPLTKGNYMSFFNKKKTNIKLLVTKYLGSDDTRPVYNTGNGCYIHSYVGSKPRYLKRDGTLENPYFREYNGDPVSWKKHIGDINDLVFAEDEMSFHKSTP